MDFTYSIQDDIIIIIPDGQNLDAKAAPQFKEKVTQLLAEQPIKNGVIDLRALQFVDSSGLGAFLSALRTLHQKGGELKLAHVNPPVAAIFELVSMNKIFEVFPTTDEAVLSFRE